MERIGNNWAPGPTWTRHVAEPLLPNFGSPPVMTIGGITGVHLDAGGQYFLLARATDPFDTTWNAWNFADRAPV